MLFETVTLYIGFWKVLFYVGTLLQIGLNSMIYIDLWLTLRNPFYPRRKRNKYYNTAIFAILTYITVILVSNQRTKGTTLDLYDFKNDDEFFVFGYKSFFVFLLLLVFLPMIRIIVILCRKGTSKDLRYKVLKYQIVYFWLYIITLISASHDLWDYDVYDLANMKDDGSLDWVTDILDTIFNSVGIFMAFNRLFEPYIWREFEYQGFIFAENFIRMLVYMKLFFQRNCCRKRQIIHTSSFMLEVKQHKDQRGAEAEAGTTKKKRKKYDYSQDALDSFLNSAMNIEMVYLILLGISNFMESTSYNKVAQEQMEMSIRQELAQSTASMKKQLVGFGRTREQHSQHGLQKKLTNRSNNLVDR